VGMRDVGGDLISGRFGHSSRQTPPSPARIREDDIVRYILTHL